jgi:hypothetical protein
MFQRVNEEFYVFLLIDVIAIPRAEIFPFTGRHQFIGCFQEVGASLNAEIDPPVTHEALRDDPDVVASVG